MSIPEINKSYVKCNGPSPRCPDLPTRVSPHHVVGGDVAGDGDGVPRRVLPHDHAVSELPARRLVLLRPIRAQHGAAQPITAHLDRGVPRVAADPAPAPDGRAPLVTLAAAETLLPVVVWRRISSSAFYISSPSGPGLVTCGVVREAVVVHDCPGGGLHHAAVPPHLPHQHRHHGHHHTLLGQHWWDLDSFGLLKQLAFALARLL